MKIGSFLKRAVSNLARIAMAPPARPQVAARAAPQGDGFEAARTLKGAPELGFPKSAGSDADFVKGLYRELLGRAPDADGMAAHLKGLATGMTRDQIKQVFLSSPEFAQTQRRGEAAPGGRTNGWSGPGGPGPGELMPTPLQLTPRPGTVSSECNTPQNKNIAPKSTYLADVNAAIDRVQAKGIGLDPNDRNRITDFDKYHNAVVQELLRSGFDAAYDGEEMAVSRRGAAHSEQFDISTSTSLVRRFYASQTTPPVFDV